MQSLSGERDIAYGLAIGDGKADYLCMEKNGRTTGAPQILSLTHTLTNVAFVNNYPSGVRNVGQIKFSEEKDRANHRWADASLILTFDS